MQMYCVFSNTFNLQFKDKYLIIKNYNEII